jgi:hypothetical protein
VCAALPPLCFQSSINIIQYVAVLAQDIPTAAAAAVAAELRHPYVWTSMCQLMSSINTAQPSSTQLVTSRLLAVC